MKDNNLTFIQDGVIRFTRDSYVDILPRGFNICTVDGHSEISSRGEEQ